MENTRSLNLSGGIHRTTYTWVAYAMLGYFAYMQASLSPLMLFLREEMNMSYALGGLHLSAFALGMTLAGLTGDRVVGWAGRWRAFWYGGAGMFMGGLLMVTAQIPALTLLACLIMGLLGGYLIIMVQSTLADQFGMRRAIALTEANITASAFSAFVPAFISLGMRLMDNWRGALWIGMGGWALAFWLFRGLDLPQKRAAVPPGDGSQVDELPRGLWIYWLILFLGVSAEWSVIFWTPDFLATHVKFSAEDASLLMSLFFVAVILGRMVGSWLTHQYRALHLLILAEVIILAGFPLLWLAKIALLNVVGLVLVGIGAANLFPMALSAVSNAGAARSDRTSAYVTGSAGLAILTMPLLLGNIADQIGIFNAFGLVLVILLLLPIASYFALHIKLPD